MTLPRLVVLMGSGETSPTMVKTHRQLMAQLGPSPVPTVLLDTPFGFQANAADLTRRAQSYFRDSVGQPVEVAGFRSDSEVGTVAYEAMLSRLRQARYVFAGPGSPTYALRHLWEQRPRALYPLVEVPVLLLPCDDGSPSNHYRREEVAAAEAGLHRSRTVWQAADHDVHAQHPRRVAGLLMECVADGFFA